MKFREGNGLVRGGVRMNAPLTEETYVYGCLAESLVEGTPVVLNRRIKGYVVNLWLRRIKPKLPESLQRGPLWICPAQVYAQLVFFGEEPAREGENRKGPLR
jgi:hypothetical protein